MQFICRSSLRSSADYNKLRVRSCFTVKSSLNNWRYTTIRFSSVTNERFLSRHGFFWFSNETHWKSCMEKQRHASTSHRFEISRPINVRTSDACTYIHTETSLETNDVRSIVRSIWANHASAWHHIERGVGNGNSNRKYFIPRERGEGPTMSSDKKHEEE